MSRSRRSNAALAVAFLALLVALGGSAGADPVAFVAKAVKGSSIKKGSVPANRIKRNSLTGAQIRESKLGTVPKAKAATTAAKATTADTATTAANATNAGSATTAGSANTAGRADSAKAVDGRVPFGLKRAAPTTAPTEAGARASAPRVELATVGSFAFYGKCFIDTSGPTMHAEMYIASTTEGAVFDSEDDDLFGSPTFLGPATPETDRVIYEDSEAPNNAYYEGDDYTFSAASAGGQAIDGHGAVGVRFGTTGADGAWGSGNACLFSGLANITG